MWKEKNRGEINKNRSKQEKMGKYKNSMKRKKREDLGEEKKKWDKKRTGRRWEKKETENRKGWEKNRERIYCRRREEQAR